jgi:branched-chain amino acid transport system permease protein
MKGITRSLLVSLWFMILTFPIMGMKVSQIDQGIIWRLDNILYLGIGVFALSFVWRALLVARGVSSAEEADLVWFFDRLDGPARRGKTLAAVIGVFASMPLRVVAANIALRLARGGAVEDPWGALPPALGIAALGWAAATLAWTGKGAAIRVRFREGAQRLGEPGLPRSLALGLLFLTLLPLPWLVDIYRVNVLGTTFVWVMLGLGLNIVVGQAGLLVLGYVAFYAVGAYTYAVGNAMFGSNLIGFWTFLPIGGLFAAIAGILLSLPVLRLRGDYLAIVTLGFGEIVRVTLEGGGLSLAPVASIISLFTDAPLPAWLTTPINLGGPAGIGGIPYPGFFGLKLSMDDSIRFVYYIALAMAILTIVAVARLRDSRVGRSWAALREDEIACEAMGINKVTAKLSAFALGACWAGFGGVLFAAKTNFINPTSFTFMESALILSVVVLGGMGSIVGVVLGAVVLILLPEYLRSFNEYRMLIFGACMVLMMVFRPQGLITPRAKKRRIAGVNDGDSRGESA